MAELIEARSKKRPPVLAFASVTDPERSAEIGAALAACGYPALVPAAGASSDEPRDRLARVLDEARTKSIEYVLWLDGRALPGHDSVTRLVEALLGDASLAGVGPTAAGTSSERPRHVDRLHGFGLYRVRDVTVGPSGLVCGPGRLASLPWVAAKWIPGEAP